MACRSSKENFPVQRDRSSVIWAAIKQRCSIGRESPLDGVFQVMVSAFLFANNQRTAKGASGKAVHQKMFLKNFQRHGKTNVDIVWQCSRRVRKP